jgi:hypothetical protein
MNPVDDISKRHLILQGYIYSFLIFNRYHVLKLIIDPERVKYIDRLFGVGNNPVPLDVKFYSHEPLVFALVFPALIAFANQAIRFINEKTQDIGDWMIVSIVKPKSVEKRIKNIEAAYKENQAAFSTFHQNVITELRVMNQSAAYIKKGEPYKSNRHFNDILARLDILSGNVNTTRSNIKNLNLDYTQFKFKE